jgi:hypothetical protein
MPPGIAIMVAELVRARAIMFIVCTILAELGSAQAARAERRNGRGRRSRWGSEPWHNTSHSTVKPGLSAFE